MTEENAPLTGPSVLRWLVIGVVLVACLVAYFVYSPRVQPVLAPAPVTTQP